MQPVDLNAVARDAADAERERAESAGVALDVRQSDQPALVNGVPSGLRRVVASLLDNALGHIDSGGTVSVEVTRSGTEVRLVVADTGVGLGDVEPESLFERFARGSHGSGRRYGIGLALVREVVTAHGGTISAGSSDAGGAAFTVVLPAAAADPADQTDRA
jgi:signal transduction histidine kinase